MLNFVFNMTIFLFLFFPLFVYSFFPLLCSAQHMFQIEAFVPFYRYKNYERSSTQKIRYVILCECSGDLSKKKHQFIRFCILQLNVCCVLKNFPLFYLTENCLVRECKCVYSVFRFQLRYFKIIYCFKSSVLYLFCQNYTLHCE